MATEKTQEQIVDEGYVSDAAAHDSAPPSPAEEIAKAHAELEAAAALAAAEPKTPVKEKTEPQVPAAPKKKRAAPSEESKKKKKAPKQKGLGLPSASETRASCYYDIQNFTINVTAPNGELPQALATMMPALPGTTTTSNGGLRVTAPPPPPNTPAVKMEEPAEEEVLPMILWPSKIKIEGPPVFCSQCGLRISKHAVRYARNGTQRYQCFVCPDISNHKI